ncbi:MAG: formate dehydrogenase accessory sulfurtransferase FdhD [Candidatus Aminicenantales bacterium]
MKSKKKVRLTRFSPRGLVRTDDFVAAEEPLVIYINEKPFVSLFSTPDALQALAVGFLYASGILRDKNDLAAAEIEVKDKAVLVKTDRQFPKERPFGIGSGCGGNLLFGPTGLIAPLKSDLRVSPEMIFSLTEEFQSRALIFKETGGTHCAAVCGPEEILFFAEDIGRHNAVDKVIGQALLAGVPLEDKLLLLSGRIAYDISIKAARGGIPICVSRAAPTSAALEFGERIGLTMIGFVRGKRLNIYTHPERILL